MTYEMMIALLEEVKKQGRCIKKRIKNYIIAYPSEKGSYNFGTFYQSNMGIIPQKKGFANENR